MLPTRSSLISFSLHVLFVVLLCWFSFRPPGTTRILTKGRAPLVFHRFLKTGPARGGGSQSLAPPSHGDPPRATHRSFTPPQTLTLNDHPRLVMPTAMDAPPDLSATSANIGDPNGLLQGISGGPGGPRGIGIGDGSSIGSGRGGDFDGAFNPGHGVSMPVPIHKVEPEYSELARKAKMSGTVLVACVVGADGLPRDLKVMRSVGLGLDEKALEAVSQWRFKPGTRSGRSVAVMAVIEVSFRIL